MLVCMFVGSSLLILNAAIFLKDKLEGLLHLFTLKLIDRYERIRLKEAEESERYVSHSLSVCLSVCLCFNDLIELICLLFNWIVIYLI